MSASSNEIEEFLCGGLVLWLESCLPRPEILSGYQSLLDGTIIYTVCLQIDPEPQHHLIKLNDLDGVALINTRAKNFDAIVKNLKVLYEDELEQRLLVLPDCSILGHSPETRAGLEQMKLLLTLLLGAAVQCPNKELFIGRIKELDLTTQHAIVELIKQVTDNQTLVLTNDSLEQLPTNKMYNHIIRLAKERDHYHSNWISSMANEVELLRSQETGTSSSSTIKLSSTSTALSSSSLSSSSSTATTTTDTNHMAVELADLKSKLRKIRQELEEKSESYMETKEELEHKNLQYEKLRTESLEWYTESRRAAAYRDEVDILRERAERADKLEIEIQRFREKLSDAEFYKSRVEELREDNRLLLETKEMLEDQLQKSRKRTEHAMVLESEIIKYKQKLNDLVLERDADRNKLQELLDENTQLQLATKHLIGTNIDTDNSHSDLEEESASGDNSLSEQLTNNAQSRALKLELENRRLLAALETIKESSFHETSNKILDLEKDKKKLTIKLEQFQENTQRMQQQNQELEDVFKNALEENKKLQDALDTNKQTNDKQTQDREIERMKIIDLEKYVESLNKEKQRIQTLSDSIQRRANDLERTVETKTKDVDTLKLKVAEFDNLTKEIYELKLKVTTYEKENLNLTKDVCKLRENLESKDVLLDENIEKIELQSKEIQKLLKNLDEHTKTQQKIQELEKYNKELLSQNKIDVETITTLQKDLITGTLATKKVKQGLEKLGFDEKDIDVDLNVENVVEKLVKNPETFKTVREIMLNVGKEISSTDICVLCHRKEIYTVEKQIEISNTDAETKTNDFLNQAESAVAAQWKEQCDQLTVENSSLNTINETLQCENARQKVDVSTLSSQITSLNTQHVALQLANSQLAADKDLLVKRLEEKKQQHKILLHDQLTLQCLHEQLNSEYESLNKDKELLKNSLREGRTENRDLRDKEIALEKCIKELRIEIDTMKKGSVSLGNLRAEHSKLKDDFRNLFSTSEKLKFEYKNIQEQYRTIRTENNRLKLQNTELSGDLNSRTDQRASFEIELTKVTQRCEMLLQMNANLDTDRRTLMDHVSQLLSQYHELLAHSLEDKQHYHDEEKLFSDKVNNLHRQKEKLEEKIMEHYRKLESCSPKKKAFGSSFVKRVRKAGTDLMNKVPSRNRRSWIDDGRLTQSNFTLGSESGGNESDNSMEEPNSAMSDTILLQKYSKLRQTLPRKPKENDGGGESTLTRGGIRSSLQSIKKDDNTTGTGTLLRNNNNNKNIENIEVPEMTTSLNLGTAGSRRTVYLVDDKIPDTQQQNTPTNPTPGTPTPTNENTNNDKNPSTFLMYNRISTMIGGNGGGNINGDGSNIDNHNPVATTTSPNINNGVVNDKLSTSDKKKDSKETAVWYEYGCV